MESFGDGIKLILQPVFQDVIYPDLIEDRTDLALDNIEEEPIKAVPDRILAPDLSLSAFEDFFRYQGEVIGKAVQITLAGIDHLVQTRELSRKVLLVEYLFLQYERVDKVLVDIELDMKRKFIACEAVLIVGDIAARVFPELDIDASPHGLNLVLQDVDRCLPA